MFWGLYSTLFGGLNSSKATSPVNCHPSITNNFNVNTTVSSILSVCICLRETICVNNWMSLIFLVFARSSAYFDYTLYMLLFLTKARNLRKWLSCTPISEFINLTDSHNLHVFAGTIVSFEVLSHSFFHLLRWAVNNELRLIWYSQTGYTGLITLCLTPLIAWPMMCRRCKSKVSYETRKVLHYLSIIWGVSICFHAPAMRIFYLIGVPLATYLLDWLYGLLFASYHLPTLQMVRMGKFVEITWKHPVGYVSNGSGYVYLCLPWVSKYEWHVFSVIAHPTKPNHSSICMTCIGDWTKTIHSMLTQPSSRPGWIYGPFPSEFSDANKFDNLAICATGIGITPVISTLVSLKNSRKVNVIWMVRDPELIEFYLRYRCFSDDAFTLIFYTGDIKLLRITDPSLITPWIKIIRGRPNLKSVIPSIICAAEDHLPLPKELLYKAKIAEQSIFYTSYKNSFEQLQIDVGCYLKNYDAQEIFLQAVALSTNYVPPAFLITSRNTRTSFSVRKSHVEKQIIKEKNNRQYTTDRARSSYVVSSSITEDGECLKYNEEDSQVHSSKTSSLKPYRVNSSVSKEGMQKLLVENICKSEQSKQVAIEAICRAFDDSTLVLTSTSRMHFTEFYTILEKLETIVESSNNNTSTKVVPRINSIKKIQEMWKGAAKKVNVLARANSGRQSSMRRLDAWGVFFCGGSKPVIRVLKELHEETGISLMVESFNY
jgi:predicted ferric reductase